MPALEPIYSTVMEHVIGVSPAWPFPDICSCGALLTPMPPNNNPHDTLYERRKRAYAIHLSVRIRQALRSEEAARA